MMRWRIDPRHQDDLHLSLGLLFPAAAGLALFGGRCIGVIATIAVGALVGRLLLSRLRTWTATPRKLSLVIQSAVVGLFCPATLFDLDRRVFDADARWPTLVALGLLLAAGDWTARRFANRRWHAAVVVVTLLTLVTPALVQTDRVLKPRGLLVGDVLDSRTFDRPTGAAEPWMNLNNVREPVIVTTPAAGPLQAFLRRHPPPGRAIQTVARLLSDDLPPLEDLVVGGQPAAIGRGSLIALLVGGLFLVYRRLTPLRVPAMALLACYATLIVLPLPAGVGTGGGGRRWLFERDPRVGWAAGLTLVHYLLAASTVPAVATLLLTQPGVRPRGRGGFFAIAFGILAGVGTVFVSVTGGAPLALLVLQAAWPRRVARAAAPSVSLEAIAQAQS